MTVRPKPTPPPPPPPSRNTAPVAGDDEVTLDQGGRITLSAATLLANDRDADGDTLRITAVSKATANISVSPTPASSWRITSIDVQHDGSDTPTTASFEYTITDSAGATATATVTLTIALTATAPVIDRFSAPETVMASEQVTLRWVLSGGPVTGIEVTYSAAGDAQGSGTLGEEDRLDHHGGAHRG